MSEGKELWEKYCGFLDKSFSEQVEYSEKKKKEYFEKWKNTKMAKQLCPEGVQKLEDVPLTTYEDYPILHEFGKRMEELEKTVPRKKGELSWDYYTRIGARAAPTLEAWMVDEYSHCLKTSGTGGDSKWFANGNTMWENAVKIAFQVVILAASDEWGTTKIKIGDKFLNVGVPAPYGSSIAAKLWERSFESVPPAQIVENIPGMRKRITLIRKTIEKGEKIDFVLAPASLLSLLSEYLTNPEEFFRDRYESLGPGIGKPILYLKYLQAKIGRKKYEKARKAMPLKALISTAWDGTPYLGYLRDQFGLEPFNFYVASETNAPFMGRPHRKFDLFPNQESVHIEFLGDRGEIKKIYELEKDQVYEPVLTTFGCMTVRYQIGDLFRVIDFEDDGTPIFRFESRKIGMLDIYGYFRLSEAMVRDALQQIGLSSTEKWVASQELQPKEKVRILMEKEWEHSEQEAAKLIFESLRRINPDFENYVTDCRIKDPSEVLEVEYLKRGAFMRYTMKKAKEGVPLGQIKPPRIITPDQRELADRLRSV